MNMIRSLRVSGRSASPHRRVLLLAWPLAALGGVAYTIGALTAAVGPPTD
jgi:hypothetical protein